MYQDRKYKTPVNFSDLSILYNVWSSARHFKPIVLSAGIALTGNMLIVYAMPLLNS